MVALTDLWLPIVLSAVAVFVTSALAWMALPHHKGDFKQLPNEDDVMSAVRDLNIAPGLYFFPHMQDCSKAKVDPVAKEKFEKGPHGLLHVWPADAFGKMGRNMLFSFIFYVIVGVFIAYLAMLAIPAEATGDRLLAGAAGPAFMEVFRFTATAAFMAYAFAIIPQAIWFGTPLRNTVACIFDGIVYAAMTGLLFAWLWPGV